MQRVFHFYYFRSSVFRCWVATLARRRRCMRRKPIRRPYTRRQRRRRVLAVRLAVCPRRWRVRQREVQRRNTSTKAPAHASTWRRSINNGRICVAIVARRWVSGEPSHALASMATTLIFRSMLSGIVCPTSLTSDRLFA